MAVQLFQTGQRSLAQASRLAGLSLEEFLELLGQMEVPAVDYPPEELEQELEDAR